MKEDPKFKEKLELIMKKTSNNNLKSKNSANPNDLKTGNNILPIIPLFIDWKKKEIWAAVIQKFIKDYMGSDISSQSIYDSYGNHSEVAILMYIIQEEIDLNTPITIDIASIRDACMQRCNPYLNGFVEKYKNVTIRFSGSQADQPGSNNDTRPKKDKKVGIRYQIYKNGPPTKYDSGDFQEANVKN